MKNSINFYEVLQHEKKQKINKSKSSLWLYIVFILNVAIVLICMFLNGQFKIIEQQYKDRRNVPIVDQTIKHDLSVKQDINSSEKGMDTMKKYDKDIADIRGFKTSIYSTINKVKPSNVMIKSFSFSDNQLSIGCIAQYGDPAADYVKALESTNAFSAVIYKGFTGSGNMNNVVFTIECTMKDGNNIE